MDHETTCEETEPRNCYDDDDIESDTDKTCEKIARGKGGIRGQGKKRGRGGMTRAKIKKRLKSSEISDIAPEEIDEEEKKVDLAEVSMSKFQGRKTRQATVSCDKAQNSSQKLKSGRKASRGSTQNDMEESGQPPGEGIRCSSRKRPARAAFEEPPDSPLLSDDDQSEEEVIIKDESGANPAAEERVKEVSPRSMNEEDFYGFSNTVTEHLENEWEETSLHETPSVDKDNGSEAGSESEDKPHEEKDLRKRGRGRPAMQWKRGRRRKSPTVLHLPVEATTDLPDYLKDELQHAFEIYCALRSVPKIAPFVDKPSANMFGMSAYYSVIKSPMWFDEVKRKLMCHGYSSISQFIFDIRLMLENCYKYWGQEHKFSRIALQIESKLEQKIESLPESLRDKCKETLLHGSDDGDFIKLEPDDFRNFSEEVSENVKNKYKNFSSKILTRLSMNLETIDLLNPDFDKTREAEVLAWERTHLMASNSKNYISSSWELAAIGLFLDLTHEYLNIKRVRRYEIERMILMPKESTTLATIMTTLLSSSTVRSKLDATVPIMSFQVWNKRLRKKVEDWFSVYYNKNGSESEVFLSCGIEPQFWRALQHVNHYEDKDFSEIDFHVRCAIMKALCDNLCCVTKSFQELLLAGNPESTVGCFDKFQIGLNKGDLYFYIPSWPDVRVYKSKAVSTKQVDSVKTKSVLTNKLISYFTTNDISDESKVVPNSILIEEFELISETPEELTAFMQKMKCLNSDMTLKLQQLSLEVQKHYSSPLPILSQMYDQWTSYSSRSSAANVESVSYWEISEDVSSDKGYFDVEDPEVLGKRMRKTKLSTSNLTSSEEEEDIFDHDDDDGSDWECPSEKKKKSDANPDYMAEYKLKKKKPKIPKIKKTKTDSNEKKPKPVKKLISNASSLDNSQLSSSVVIKSVHSLSANLNASVPDDIVIKTEPATTVKVEVEDDDIIEKNKKTGISENETKDTNNAVQKEIKKEVISDVISLSSQDEDEDDDVIITTPAKQMPQPVPVTTPTSIKTPVNNVIVNKSPVRTPTPLVRSPLVNSPRLSNPGTPPTASPRGTVIPSPRMSSPRQVSPRLSTPRQRFSSPIQQSLTPPMMGNIMYSRQRTASPRSFVPSRPSPPPPNQVSRNLFNNLRQPQPSQTNPPNSKNITAKLTFGKRDDGSYGYLARLPDGGVINMSPQQIDSIKKKNGSIPSVINIPIG